MLNKLNNPVDKCDLKFASDDSTGEFEGYGSVWDSNDQINDTIIKGAFADSIKTRLPKMFINHDHSAIPVGDWLTAKEDDIGLNLAGRIDLHHKDGPSLYSAMKRSAMSGLSTGVISSTMKFTKKADGGRIITKSDLREVSVVTFPMEESAIIVNIKSDIEGITDLKDAESFLRDSGMYSRAVATAFVSQLKALCRSDSDAELKQQIAELQSQINGFNQKSELAQMLDKYDISKLIG